MRRLGTALTAAMALLLGSASFATATGGRPNVVIEEPADLAVDPARVDSLDGSSAPRVVVASPPAVAQPVWPFVLIAASGLGLSVMAVKAR
jgi:hypothetical protein